MLWSYIFLSLRWICYNCVWLLHTCTSVLCSLFHLTFYTENVVFFRILVAHTLIYFICMLSYLHASLMLSSSSSWWSKLEMFGYFHFNSCMTNMLWILWSSPIFIMPSHCPCCHVNSENVVLFMTLVALTLIQFMLYAFILASRVLFSYTLPSTVYVVMLIFFGEAIFEQYVKAVFVCPIHKLLF